MGVRLPKIFIDLEPDLKTGTIKIANSVHFNKKFENTNISSALNNYVIDRYYLSNSQNEYVYEIYDKEAMKSFIINSFDEFKEFVSNNGEYQLQLDERSVAKLQGMLIVGATRSGKTYFIYYLILQLCLKKKKCTLYFADPKRSSLYVLGKHLIIENNSCEIDDIITDLKVFYSNMKERENEMEIQLNTKIDADYRDFNLKPSIFIIDEYASFIGVVQTLPKEQRDEVNSIIRSIVLMGNQLGYFLIIIMQKSDATTIPTMIRDNLTFKVVLGNAEDTTYTTSFGTGVEIPLHNFKTGEGVFTESGIINTPKLLAIPTLNFDILSAVKELVNTVTG